MNPTNISTIARVIIDVTRRCNLSCWYCHSTSGPEYRGPEIDVTRIPNIFDTAEQLKVFEITITGGEPILWRGLPLLMENSHRLEFTKLQIITNATLISTEIVKILRRANLSRICVSLDGVEHLHAKNRGKGMYEQTIAGIQRLREVVDNITVISVLDNLNCSYWSELTEVLIKAGVKQHHLAPVCFSGNAMERYRGLSQQQFAEVREQVEAISRSLPDGYLVAFNDSLVNGLRSRYMTLQIFTEQFKGWHIVIRPTGQVNTSVNGWGRSWRAVAMIGDINQAPLSQLIQGYSATINEALRTQFSHSEEIRRKFHVSATQEDVLSDITDVRCTETGFGTDTCDAQISRQADEIVLPAALGINLDDLKILIAANPDRYRLRREDGFWLLFDTTTFNVCILNNQEILEVKGVNP
ncbi:MAG: radical SAM protein [bacterium]|nr:radical SAM protein [bacterium]